MDQSSFESLITPLIIKDMHRYACKFTRNTYTADDLLQDTLMRAFIYAEQFQEGTNFIGWIKTIMKTIYIGNYNHNKRVSRVFTLTPLFDNYDYTSHDSVSQVENKIMLERIKKMTSKLNGIHQKVISGILIEGSSYGEVSNETGVCFATTRSRLYRAKKMLRKINKKEIENERS